MLPPKLARVLLNLAEIDFDKKILDPFCGSGTILAEAAVMGFKNLYGADRSTKAIESSRENLEWIMNQYGLKNINLRLYNEKVENLSKKFKTRSFDGIITEPYLGPPLHGNESQAFLRTEVQNLQKLYIRAFQNFSRVLKPGAAVVFLIPKFFVNNSRIKPRVSSEIKKTGFLRKPFFNDQDCIIYHRPGQYLAREIHRFTKT